MKPSPGSVLLDRLVLPGMAGFTNLGYRFRSRRFTRVDDDLAGRTVVVTGSTSGLGRAAAEAIAGLGAATVLVARSAERAERARSEIAETTGNGAVTVELADLSLMSDVRDLGTRLLESHREIHVLVNNAGALFNERRETDEGIELTLATNLLSGFLLTNMLLERLRESAPARIVNVSSGGMYTQGISLSNLQWTRGEYNGSRAYARTKRGQVILTELWHQLLEGSQVTVNAMHPGWAATPGVEASLPGFDKVMGPLLRTAEQGADTIVWLAASAEAAARSGGFYLDRQPHVTEVLPGTGADRSRKLALWQALAELSGWDGPAPRGPSDLS
jgi:NAD(P)-dependent dehydrogenase (short-subunit alcohol dehydrogenase family)